MMAVVEAAESAPRMQVAMPGGSAFQSALRTARVNPVVMMAAAGAAVLVAMELSAISPINAK